MEEKINPQDPVQSAKDSVKKAAENLHTSAEAKAAQFQDAAQNAWPEAQSRAKLGRWRSNHMSVKIRPGRF